MSEIEIITDGDRRRRWPAAEKLRIVEETLYDGESISAVARRNGVAPTVKDTHIFARHLGLKSCFTPVKSPQSNGISEAFVKTFKRDYVRVNPLPDAESVLSSIENRIEDDNENHPHSGLKWKSPREFIRANTETA